MKKWIILMRCAQSGERQTVSAISARKGQAKKL